MKAIVRVDVEVEKKDRVQFQKEGHMLFGLYGPGDSPDDPPIRRQWEGPDIFIATLRGEGGDKQLLRVMSDTELRAIEAMRQLIVDTLIGAVRVTDIKQFDYQQFLKLNTERNRMSEFIEANYAWEIANSKHDEFATIFDVAIYYLKKERSRLSMRIARLFRRQPRAGVAQ